MSSARAEAVFKKVSSAVGVSDAGKAYLTAAIDPFHDEPIMGLRGIPDGIASENIVQEVRGTITIVAPEGLGEGESWDCHIQSLPFLKPTTEQRGYTPYLKNLSVANSETNVFLADQSATLEQLGSIVISSAKTGVSALGVFGGSQPDTTRRVLNPGINFTEGSYRLISKGYETISSGPALYRSGDVFIYGMPTQNSQQSEVVNVVGLEQNSNKANTYRSALKLPKLPLTSAQAILVAGSQSWKAEKGTYMIDRMNDPHVSTFGTSGMCGLVTTQTLGPDSSTNPADVGSKVSFMTVPAVATNCAFATINPQYLSIICGNNGTDMEPFHITGNYFSGLNPQDKLTVNAIWYIERFPDSTQPDLQTLAKPSPVMDQQALDFYSSIISEMPYGMIQSANGFGDWFKDAASVVLDNVAPAFSALPGPIGNIAKVATVGGNILRGVLGSKDKERADAPAFYSPEGKQPTFIEEVVVPKVTSKNMQPRKKKAATPPKKKKKAAMKKKKK